MIPTGESDPSLSKTSDGDTDTRDEEERSFFSSEELIASHHSSSLAAANEVSFVDEVISERVGVGEGGGEEESEGEAIATKRTSREGREEKREVF